MADLRATYLGHATAMIEVPGVRLLTDPLLRSSLMGLLRRRHGLPALDFDGLDAVLISHVHHDHLDLPTLRRLPRDTPIVVPAGAGRLLARHGFGAVAEIEVGDRLRFGGLEVVATPAVHRAARRGARSASSLGYLVRSADSGADVYFAGDTELFEGMDEISAELDLALLPIWGWGPSLGSGHMNPRQAAEALGLLRPARVVPIHWGTYTPIGAPRIWPWMTHSPVAGFADHARSAAPATEVAVLSPGQSILARAD
jgi:L-ascorbate metabolism protein UlaG (beta-lactamase superfamily)